MGVAISKNVANSAKQIGIDVTNSFTQKCKSNISQTENVTVNKCPNAKISEIDFSQTDFINQECIQNDQAKSQIKQQITERLNQNAQAVTQSLGLPSFSEADVISNASVKLAETISNSYQQTCVVKAVQQSGFKCNKSAGVTIGVIKFDQSSTSISNCMQMDTAINIATQDYARAVETTAAAKQANAFGASLIAFFILLGFSGYIFVQLAKSDVAKWTIIGIIVIIVLVSVGYGFTAYENRLWPFQKTQ